jgi:hypothetical protein
MDFITYGSHFNRFVASFIRLILPCQRLLSFTLFNFQLPRAFLTFGTCTRDLLFFRRCPRGLDAGSYYPEIRAKTAHAFDSLGDLEVRRLPRDRKVAGSILSSSGGIKKIIRIRHLSQSFVSG